MPEPSTRAFRGAISAGAAEPALAVLAPFLFVQAFDAVVRLGILAEALPAAPPASLLVALLVAVGQTAVGGWLRRERVVGLLPRLRELVLLTAAAWLLLLVLSGRPFRGDFSPLQPCLAWPLVLCVAQWVLTTHVRASLEPRRLFFSLVAGRTGHDLVAAARDAGGEAGESSQRLRGLSRFTAGLEAAAVLPYLGLAGVAAATGGPGPSAWVTVRVLAFAAAGVVFNAALKALEAEQELCLAGIAPDHGKALRGLAGPCAGILGLFGAGLLLAGRAPLLPLSLIQRFLDWLSSLFPSAPAQAPAAAPRQEAPAAGMEDLQRMMGGPGAAESPLLRDILRIAGIVLAVAAAGAFVWFIVRPLFSAETRRSLLKVHPVRTAARKLARFLRLLARLPGALAAWARAPRGGLSAMPRAILEAIREAADGRPARGRDGTRAAARGRAVRELRRLARWGGRAGVAFADTEGPMEYVRRLAASAPAKAAALDQAGLLIEELVYAPAPAAGAERMLSRAVDGIVR
jgi:hypothetical protein